MVSSSGELPLALRSGVKFAMSMLEPEKMPEFLESGLEFLAAAYAELEMIKQIRASEPETVADELS